MEFLVGTLGLGSEPRRAARLAGGTLNELEEGGPVPEPRGQVLGALRLGVGSR